MVETCDVRLTPHVNTRGRLRILFEHDDLTYTKNTFRITQKKEADFSASLVLLASVYSLSCNSFCRASMISRAIWVGTIS